ncbi:hypothetical protein [Vibrio cortegadensis]|uniref:Uncharacterized protein n=1 Tax=Vibrio cortegadensis TaxID=1328770 RepID=A0ABV4M969_9VIBR
MMKVKSTDLRECKSYWRFIKEIGATLPMEPSTSKGYCDILTNLFETFYKERFQGTQDEAMKDFRNIETKMIERTSNTIIPTNELEWLNNIEERMCYWIWCLCRLASSDKPSEQSNDAAWNANFQQAFNFPWGLNLYLDFQPNKIDRPYVQSNLSLNPLSSTETKKLIIEFLDILPTDIEIKRELIKLWKKEWEAVCNLETFSWVQNNNQEQSDWLTNYIINNSETKLPTWFIPTSITAKQKSSAVITAFDLWPAHPDTKRMFVHKMKKAWGQKKHRMKMDKTNRKAYSITMSTDAKSKLDEMALAATMNKNDFLESIILKEYGDFMAKNNP